MRNCTTSIFNEYLISGINNEILENYSTNIDETADLRSKASFFEYQEVHDNFGRDVVKSNKGRRAL